VAEIRIALGQLGAVVGDVGANLERIRSAWRAAAAQGADLIVTPELALVGYPPDDLLLRRELLDALERAISGLAAAGPVGMTAIVGTVGTADDTSAATWGVTAAAPALTNRAAVLRDGGLIATYDKMRLPNEGVFDEARYFVPGAQPCVVDVAGVPVGIIICQDLWTADGPVRASAEAGARVVVVLNASPYHLGKRAEREAWVRRHAAEHALWVCYVNRVGGQDEVVFDGDSMVADPGGGIVRRGAQFREDLLLVDIDVQLDAASPPSTSRRLPPLHEQQDEPRLDRETELSSISRFYKRT
jgi:NAD+ synthase (glutamine-hydrolysing)